MKWFADVFWSRDFVYGLVTAGLVTWGGVRYDNLLTNDVIPVVLVEAGLGLALLAVVLTALSIFVAFLGEVYTRFLEEAIGLPRAFRPYKTVATIAGLQTLTALGTAFTWTLAGEGVRIGLLAAVSGLTVWAIAGTVKLTAITANYGNYRSRLRQIPAAAREQFAQERKKRATP
jgi:hypothetical protein